MIRHLHRALTSGASACAGKAVLLIVVLFTCALACAAEPIPCSPRPTRLTTAADFASGAMRGATLMDLRADGTSANTDHDFIELAGLGANLTRIFMYASRCPDCSTYTLPTAELAQAKRILHLGHCHGFKVVVSLNTKPGFAKAEYWDNEHLKASLIQVWKDIAAALKGEPALAAYELINEPVPPHVPLLRNRHQVWASLASRMVDAIRSVDPSHVIIYEPAPWAFPSGFKDMEPLAHRNIVYSFHFYEPRKFSHQGLYEHKESVIYPDEEWNKKRLSSLLDPVRAFVRRTGAPVYVGEFSAVRWAPKATATNYVRDLIELFEEEGWSWTYHVWRGYHGWDAEVPADTPNIKTRGFLPEARRRNTPTLELLKRYFSLNQPLP